MVLRLSRASIERIETDDPALAAALHRWLATTLSERLTDTQRAAWPSSTRSAGGRNVSEQRRSAGMFASLAAGVIIGAVEAVLAIAFAAFVFGGLLVSRLADGIGLYLVAAALTLGILAWRAGRRGVVGSVQDAAAAVLAVVAATTAAKAADIAKVAQATGLKDYEKPDVFLTVIAATLVVTILCGVVFLGARDVPARQPGAVRAVPGRRRIPRRHRMAPLQGRHLRRVGDRGPPAHDRAHAPLGGAQAHADRARVRPDPAVRRPAREEAAGHPGRARDRSRGVRDRHGRHGLVDRHREGRWMAPRAVRDGPAVATVDVPRARRRRLVGGARTSRRHRHRRARRRRSPSCSTSAGPRSCCTGTSTRTGSSATPESSTSSRARSAASPGITRSA